MFKFTIEAILDLNSILFISLFIFILSLHQREIAFTYQICQIEIRFISIFLTYLQQRNFVFSP